MIVLAILIFGAYSSTHTHTHYTSHASEVYQASIIYILQNRPFAPRRHFITMTRILQGIAFLCKLRLLLFRAVFTWLSKGIGFGFGFTTPFGWLVHLLWFWFYDSQVKTALNLTGITKFKYKRKHEMNSGLSSKNSSSCEWPIEVCQFLHNAFH